MIVARGLPDAARIVEMGVHRSELVNAEQAVSPSVTRLPEKDAPGEATLIPTAIAKNSGAKINNATTAPAISSRRLSMLLAGSAEQPCGGSSDVWRMSDVVREWAAREDWSILEPHLREILELRLREMRLLCEMRLCEMGHKQSKSFVPLLACGKATGPRIASARMRLGRPDLIVRPYNALDRVLLQSTIGKNFASAQVSTREKPA